MSANPLAEIVAAMEEAGVLHMIAGSVASSYHGEPRSTQDIDLVILATQESVDRFVALLDSQRFYVTRGVAATVVRDMGMFNIIDQRSGWKLDCIACTDRPFSREEFGRRIRVSVFGVEVAMATGEDVVLAKLEWSLQSGSERQFQDVVSILRVGGGSLDAMYLAKWARELGVTELLTDAWQSSLDAD